MSDPKHAFTPAGWLHKENQDTPLIQRFPGTVRGDLFRVVGINHVRAAAATAPHGLSIGSIVALYADDGSHWPIFSLVMGAVTEDRPDLFTKPVPVGDAHLTLAGIVLSALEVVRE